MFGGNAKTHFQVLGRDRNSTGYMMSPFGDDRWDLDDIEKLKKINKLPNLKNTNQIKSSSHNLVCPPHSQSLEQPGSHQSGKQPYCGYINQSEAYHGYIPKSEIVPSYQRSSSQPQYAYYYNQEPYQKEAQHVQYQRPETAIPKPSMMDHHNGLTQTDARRLRSMYSQPTRVTQNLSQVPNICGNCLQNSADQVSNAHVPQNQWKSSPDIPVWIAGSTNYKPFGPQNATPNPYFPPREKNMYMPLS